LQVLVLTVYDDADRVFDALKAGASGYLLKRATTAEILDAIREVQVGGAPMSMQIARRVVESFRTDRRPARELDMLTPREREILALLAEGGLYKDIAKSLGLSTSTVRVHLHSVYTKLHVQTRTQAVLNTWAAEGFPRWRVGLSWESRAIQARSASKGKRDRATGKRCGFPR
jgi:DNA-binding NarL/FixJ family response regulator